MNSENSPYVLPVDVILADKTICNGTLHIWDTDDVDPAVGRLDLEFAGKMQSSKGHSFFWVLREIRKVLDAEGILVRCYGCSRNVWPSSVSASMGRGVKAYRYVLGQRSSRKDIVSIFASGPDTDPCTFREQEEFHKLWLQSVGITTGDACWSAPPNRTRLRFEP